MAPLNLSLFRSLQQQFGTVKLASEGVQMDARYTADGGGRVRMTVVNAGEYYRVNCFVCGDTRHRLYVNHRWGVRDLHTGTRNYWLAHCFNDNCMADSLNRQDLIEHTTWYNREAGAGRVKICEGRTEPAGHPVPLPRDFVLLGNLCRGHPARRYLRKRGFDPVELSHQRQVGFSFEAYCLASAGRVVIPVYRVENGGAVCWGWQTRAIEPHDENRCKYFTAPKFKKSECLYGLERVLDKGPVLICEGVTDVWRAGDNAVALLGKHASTEQVRLIRKHLRGRPLVVALDPDAHDDAKDLVHQVREARTRSLLAPDDAPVVQLNLPDGRDPADFATDDLWLHVRRALRRAKQK